MDCWPGVSAGRGATKPDNLSLIPRTYIGEGRYLLPKVAFWVPDVHGGPYTLCTYMLKDNAGRMSRMRGQDANIPEAWILDTFRRRQKPQYG